MDLDHSDMGPDLSSEVALRSGYATDPGTNPGNAPKTYPLTLHQALDKLLTSVGEPPQVRRQNRLSGPLTAHEPRAWVCP